MRATPSPGSTLHIGSSTKPSSPPMRHAVGSGFLCLAAGCRRRRWTAGPRTAFVTSRECTWADVRQVASRCPCLRTGDRAASQPGPDTGAVAALDHAQDPVRCRRPRSCSSTARTAANSRPARGSTGPTVAVPVDPRPSHGHGVGISEHERGRIDHTHHRPPTQPVLARHGPDRPPVVDDRLQDELTQPGRDPSSQRQLLADLDERAPDTPPPRRRTGA